MSYQSYRCGNCGSMVDGDCIFCPQCSAPKPMANQSYPPSSAPHGWMQDSSASQGERSQQTGDRATPYQQSPIHQPSLSGAVQPIYPTQAMAVAAGPSVQPQVFVPLQQEKKSVAQASLVISILMLCVAVVGLIPCLGWLNWANLGVLAEGQHIAWWISFFTERNSQARMKRLLSLPFFLVAIFISAARLIIGGGCL